MTQSMLKVMTHNFAFTTQQKLVVSKMLQFFYKIPLSLRMLDSSHLKVLKELPFESRSINSFTCTLVWQGKRLEEILFLITLVLTIAKQT